MANISTFLQKILEAVYGEEVRGSIHDALEAMNKESSSAMEYASTAQDSAQVSAASAQDSAAIATLKGSEAVAAAEAAKTSERNSKVTEASVLEAKIAAETARDNAENSKSLAKLSETASEMAKTDAQAAEAASETARDFAEKSAETAQQYSGKPPKPQDGSWWIWDAEKQAYIDSKIGCELVGPTGNGVEDIQLTEGDHTPGTTDIYTVTMTDGATYRISVYNGRNGTGVGDVLGIWFDLVLPASGWKNGELTVADARLLALATHKYFLSADEASQDEFLECNVRPKDITATGFLTFTNDTDPAEDLRVNLIRFEMTGNGA